MPDKKQHKGKRVNLGQEGIDSIKAEKTWWQGCETAGLITAMVREQRQDRRARAGNQPSMLSPSDSFLQFLKVTQPSMPACLAGDQMFKHTTLGNISHLRHSIIFSVFLQKNVLPSLHIPLFSLLILF